MLANSKVFIKLTGTIIVNTCLTISSLPLTLFPVPSYSCPPSTAAPYQPLARCCLTQYFVKLLSPLSPASSSSYFLLARIPTLSTTYSFTSKHGLSPSTFFINKNTPCFLAVSHAVVQASGGQASCIGSVAPIMLDSGFSVVQKH